MKLTQLFSLAEKLHQPGDYFKYRGAQLELIEKKPNGDYLLKGADGKDVVVKKPDVVDLKLIDPPTKARSNPHVSMKFEGEGHMEFEDDIPEGSKKDCCPKCGGKLKQDENGKMVCPACAGPKIKKETVTEASRFKEGSAFKKLARKNRERLKAYTDSVKKEKAEFAAKLKAMKPKAPPKISDDEIWARVVSAVTNSFPDGDPIDRIWPFMERNGISMEKVNKLVKKYEGKKDFYAWLAAMWDDTQADQLHDVKMLVSRNRESEIDTNSVFFQYDPETKTAKPNENPWK